MYHQNMYGVYVYRLCLYMNGKTHRAQTNIKNKGEKNR